VNNFWLPRPGSHKYYDFKIDWALQAHELTLTKSSGSFKLDAGPLAGKVCWAAKALSNLNSLSASACKCQWNRQLL
jgi:hypothetical protein